MSPALEDRFLIIGSAGKSKEDIFKKLLLQRVGWDLGKPRSYKAVLIALILVLIAGGILPTPPDLKGQEEEGSFLGSLPILSNPLLVASIGWTQTEVRVNVIFDVVCKGQPPGVQSKVKKYAEWVWGPDGKCLAPQPDAAWWSLFSKETPIALSAPLPHPLLSVAQSCPTLRDPKDCSMPGFPVRHHLPELAQTHVHWVSDACLSSNLLFRTHLSQSAFLELLSVLITGGPVGLFAPWWWGFVLPLSVSLYHSPTVHAPLPPRSPDQCPMKDLRRANPEGADCPGLSFVSVRHSARWISSLPQNLQWLPIFCESGKLPTSFSATWDAALSELTFSEPACYSADSCLLLLCLGLLCDSIPFSLLLEVSFSRWCLWSRLLG